MTVKALKTNNMAFKMKGSPMQRNFGVGASPVNKKEGKEIKETRKVFVGEDVTKQYKETGNKATKKAIEEGGRVYKSKDGKITIKKPAPPKIGKKPAPTNMKSPVKSAALDAHRRRETKFFEKREMKDAQREAKLRKLKNVGRTNPISMKSPAKRTGGIQHFTTRERIH